MYELEAKSHFDSAHFLSGYEGKCSNIHGHRWSVRVRVKSQSLKKEGQCRGMIVDFGQLKVDLKKITNEIDHVFIIEKGTLKEKTYDALIEEGFKIVVVDFRPTAENFAKYFYEEIEKLGYDVESTKVYETPNNCAIYRKDY